MFILLGYMFVVTATLSFSTQSELGESRRCRTAETCGECIQVHTECRWCKQEDFDFNRCDILSTLLLQGCEEVSIITQKNSITVTKDEPVHDGFDGHKALHLTPQEVHLKLKPNAPFTFPLTFRLAENYPVDLYYLMDLSRTMKDDKIKLAELGFKIAEEMKSITKDFRLGFGSFVDKSTWPFARTVPAELANPCVRDKETCVPLYDYKHQMELGDDPELFSERVDTAEISGNMDDLEGGLDALMQVLVCKKQIGWRESSRKIVLYSSDGGCHLAGDGLLAGIVEPNDGRCHLDGEGLYTHSLLQDYPSISHIAREVSANNVNVIFAVSSDRFGDYEQLAAFIDGSTIGVLLNDSSNIVELIKQNYKDIVSQVELKTLGADDLQVQFHTTCLGSDKKKTNSCKKLGIGKNVTFDVTVTAPKCSSENSSGTEKLQFLIYPVGLSDRLQVNVELLCQCDCENPAVDTGNSKKCSGSGKYECGACKCNPNRYGKFCQCDATVEETVDYTYRCKKTNTSEPCEGHGVCVCGSCYCSPISTKDPKRKWAGKFCECDNYNCPYSHGQLCGGPGRGVCECSRCHCLGDNFGRNCRCPKSKKKCLTAAGVECNGMGECRCGECVCNKNPFYRGPTCEDCPTCPGKCETNRKCVECKVFMEGSMEGEACRTNCSHVEAVQELRDLDDRRLCEFVDENNCKYFFTYEYNTNKVQAQQTKECPKPVNILAIVLSIILGIIVIGLALILVWKLLVTMGDRREFAKFERERMNAKWETGENPIFKKATTTFRNPTYAGKS